MSFKPHGKHLIAGEWVAGEHNFYSEPAHGAPHAFSCGTVGHVNTACEAAEEAFWDYAYSDRKLRAQFLHLVADEIEARADAITQIGAEETGLPAARLNGERGRTNGQLRLFADHIEAGAYLDRRYDKELADRQPLPRPDIRLIQRPVGPVAVFGASNFPLAFSTAGGDTAAALAAGCPVVVKGHSAHPGTGEIIAEAIDAARRSLGLHPGVFSLIQGGTRDVGTALVQHPFIKAVGFTGSLAGGRALFNLCAARPEPIPFFGELGSVNPMFVLPAALKARAGIIGAGWAGSLTMGAGQFCTNPGIAVVPVGEATLKFQQAAAQALQAVASQVMLTDGIAKAYQDGIERMSTTKGVRQLVGTAATKRCALPYLFETTVENYLAHSELHDEVFGPMGLIVKAQSFDEIVTFAKSLEGQLTATIQLDEGDNEQARLLLRILERKAGRVLANGYPTGVEICDAMVHGGPYPASTNFGATSVGTMSIRRFLRPVSFQNIPQSILPDDLQEFS